MHIFGPRSNVARVSQLFNEFLSFLRRWVRTGLQTSANELFRQKFVSSSFEGVALPKAHSTPTANELFCPAFQSSFYSSF